MKSLYFPALFAGLLFLLSCHNENDPNSKNDVTQLKKEISVDANEVKDKEYNGFDTDTTKSPQQVSKQKQQEPVQKIPQPDWDKKIIKIASLNAEVQDYNSFYTSLREKVKQAGGYIAQEEQSQSEYKIENTVTIKVPVDQFDDAVAELSSITKKINDKKITSQDVTTEVIDTKSRMEAKRQVRSRYMDLLKEAKNMGEILSVQSEINGVQEQIESAAGRIEYLGHASVFSTINITYYQVLDVAAKNTTDPSFGSEIGHAFRMGWSWISDICVALVAVWPLFVLGFLVVIGYKKLKPGLKRVKES